jgi:hypothetical protein
MNLTNNSRSNFVEKLLFQNLSKSPDFVLDESQLRKINTIASNIPYQFIKSSYERLSFEKYTRNNRKNSPNSSSIPSINNNFSTSNQINQQEDEQNSKDTKRLSSASSSIKSLTSNLNSSTQIIIHVNDEVRKIRKDFSCPKDLLLSEMKYFDQSLNPDSGGSSSTSLLSKKNLDDIDISVHCDINIFDWLMRYVKRNHPHLIQENNIIVNKKSDLNSQDENPIEQQQAEPVLELNNCISILLSSDFLMIPDLVDKCILFISKNLESLLNMTSSGGSSSGSSIVFSGLSDNLLCKLAACYPIQKLNALTDKKDKIKSKLYQRKIRFMFEIQKYREIFDNSSVFTKWLHNEYKIDNREGKIINY